MAIRNKYGVDNCNQTIVISVIWAVIWKKYFLLHVQPKIRSIGHWDQSQAMMLKMQPQS